MFIAILHYSSFYNILAQELTFGTIYGTTFVHKNVVPYVVL